MIIRPEQEKDIPLISHLLKQAFANQPYSNNDEYLLVEKLRSQKALTLSYVAIIDSKVVGHIGFSLITINDKSCNLLGLAPVSVLPEYQGQGIGSALIKKSIKHLKENGFSGCVLVGFPDFYNKLNFVPAYPLTYQGVEEKYFMKMLFENDTNLSGEVKFHSAFYS